MKTLAVNLGLIVLVACGDDHRAPEPPLESSLTLSLTSPSLTVNLASQAMTTLQLTRLGSASGAAVSLSASALPAGVTLFFADAAPTGDSVALTVSAKTDAEQIASTVTITGTAGELSATTTLTIVVGPMTVQGRYVNAESMGRASVPVKIWSHGSQTPLTGETLADGSFSVAGVTPPYDVLFDAFDVSMLVLGLTRPDPLLANLHSTAIDDTGVTETVTVTGANIPQPGGYEGAVLVGCPNARGGKALSASGTTAPELFGSLASGDACTVSVVQDLRDQAFPSGGFAVGTATAEPGNVSIALMEITSHTLALTATADVVIGNLIVTEFFVPASGTPIEIGETAAPATPQTMAVPDDPTQALVTVQVYATSGDGRSAFVTRSAGTDATMSLAAPAFAAYASPEPAATDVTLDTPFAVANLENAVAGFIFQTTEHPTFVVTAGASTTLQTLVDHGISPSPAADQFTRVTVFDGFASVDAYATGIGSNRWERIDGSSERIITGTFTPRSP